VKVYAGMDPRLPLTEVASYAQRVERIGYDGLQISETVHDALAVSLLAAEHTERITIRTSVALAFVRSPTLTAYAAWDLASFSGGRFELGLGTQIRQNIEDRFGMPWRDPVERMREYVHVLAALYTSFRTGDAPRFEGTHYRVTRMQPYFNPGPHGAMPAPALYLGGVNAGICRLAGELAAGFVTHPTNSSPRYLETICRPALEQGARQAGRTLDDLELVCGTQIVTGASEAHLHAERERQRKMFGFLYSTPAYRRTLELYGWDDLAGRLQAMIRADRWDELGTLVTDEILDALVPTATLDTLARVLINRFAGLADAVVLSPAADAAGDEQLTEVIAGLHSERPAVSRWRGRAPDSSPTR
jgi:probable F420-dependent oxidoreductase